MHSTLLEMHKPTNKSSVRHSWWQSTNIHRNEFSTFSQHKFITSFSCGLISGCHRGLGKQLMWLGTGTVVFCVCDSLTVSSVEAWLLATVTCLWVSNVWVVCIERHVGTYSSSLTWLGRAAGVDTRGYLMSDDGCGWVVTSSRGKIEAREVPSCLNALPLLVIHRW